MKAIKNFIGYLLEYPNCNARQLPVDHRRFYTLKNRILEKYGTKDREDLQHVVKRCFQCGGTGKYHGKTCWRCKEGIYQQFYCVLSRYWLGKHMFHVPGIKEQRRPNIRYVKFIKGIIRHEPREEKAAIRAFYLLTFLFDKKLFFESISEKIRRSSPVRFIKSIRSRIRSLFAKNRLDDFKERDIPF